MFSIDDIITGDYVSFAENPSIKLPAGKEVATMIILALRTKYIDTIRELNSEVHSIETRMRSYDERRMTEEKNLVLLSSRLIEPGIKVSEFYCGISGMSYRWTPSNPGGWKYLAAEQGIPQNIQYKKDMLYP